MKKNYDYNSANLKQESDEQEYGCKFCWDRRTNKPKPLIFFDQANNMRDCKYCPWCGRQY